MIRELFGRLSGWFSRSESGEDASEASDGEDESTFVPSRLDASVLEAHGMETTAAERELAQLQEKSEQLEEQERKRESDY